jgi:signal transduction histidine kinase
MPKKQFLSTRIRARLTTLLVSTWLLAALLCVAGLAAFLITGQAYQTLISRSDGLQASALRLNSALITEALHVRAHLITGEQSSLTYRQLAHEAVERELESLKRHMSQFPSIQLDVYHSLVSQHERYDESANEMIELLAVGRTDQAASLFDARSDPLVQAIQESSQALQAEIQRGLMAEVQAAAYNNRLAAFGAVVGLLAFLGLSSLVVLLRIMPMLRDLQRFEEAVQRSAETGIYQPLTLDSDRGASTPALFGAYNQVVGGLVDSCGATMRYLRQTAHEVNSLLTPVMGYGSMIANPELRAPDADLEGFAQIIVEQTRRVTQVLEDAALAAKIEARQYAPAFTPVRLAPLLTIVTAEVGEETGRSITLEGCPVSLVVQADALGLQRAVRKLLENAVYYSPCTAPVQVVVEPSSGAERENERVQIHIRDQGLGITSNEMQQLFRPFTRLNNEITRRVPGSGLGLYLARAIVRMHRGSISVQSRPGRGSVFTITLPLENE